MLTKQEVLRGIPKMRRRNEDGEWEQIARPDFRELERITISQKCTQDDLAFLKREIAARRDALGFDENGKRVKVLVKEDRGLV